MKATSEDIGKDSERAKDIGGIMKRIRNTGIPEFQSLEEERRYWETHGPLAEGHKGRINKPKVGQKRSSFLAVRLTGEELTQLRDIAAKQGLGTSTFARVVLAQAIARGNTPTRVVTLDGLFSGLLDNLSQMDKDKFESYVKDIAIGDPDNPVALVYSGQKRTWEEFTSLFLERLLALVGVQVVIPENENDKKVKEIEEREPGKAMIGT